MQAPDHRHEPAVQQRAGSQGPLAEAAGSRVVHPRPRPGEVHAGPLRPGEQAAGLRPPCLRGWLVAPVPRRGRGREREQEAGGRPAVGLPVMREADRGQERRPDQRSRLVEADDLRRQVRPRDRGAGPQGVRPGSLATPEATGRDSRRPRHRIARQALAGLCVQGAPLAVHRQAEALAAGRVHREEDAEGVHVSDRRRAARAEERLVRRRRRRAASSSRPLDTAWG